MLEATVTRCKNGLSVNYADPRMRRRDPDCMLVADERPSDKERFSSRFGMPFLPFAEGDVCLAGEQPLVVLPLYTGRKEFGSPMLLVAPRNAAFFVGALADLQEMLPGETVPVDFEPKAVIYLAPPFRHTHFQGKQVVVHNRCEGMHEIFAYNLYPGPSAKKGVYGVLIHQGEEEGWVTAHASTVQVVTPYDNIVTILHEGASGGGKSEMLEPVHREADGQLLVGPQHGDGRKAAPLVAPRLRTASRLRRHGAVPSFLAGRRGKTRRSRRRERLVPAFQSHLALRYRPLLGRPLLSSAEPLLMLNMDGKPRSTCLIWEHIADAPGKPCSNPRVIMPRRLVPDVVNDPVSVDIRSFGIRTPPCTRNSPVMGSSDSCTFCLPPWRGCGVWSRRGDTTIPASRNRAA